jgi:hypothetical protein
MTFYLLALYLPLSYFQHQCALEATTRRLSCNRKNNNLGATSRRLDATFKKMIHSGYNVFDEIAIKYVPEIILQKICTLKIKMFPSLPSQN